MIRVGVIKIGVELPSVRLGSIIGNPPFDFSVSVKKPAMWSLHIFSLVFVLCLLQTVRSSDDKLKITDTFTTGDCDTRVQVGDLVTWKSYGYLLNGKCFKRIFLNF